MNPALPPPPPSIPMAPPALLNFRPNNNINYFIDEDADRDSHSEASSASSPSSPRASAMQTGRVNAFKRVSGEIVSKWSRVEHVKGVRPCQRSLHSGVVWNDNLLIFGGYNGHERINDLHCYSFTSCKWINLELPNAPSPRDRHIAAVYENELYIFGGFDGISRINDMHVLNLETYQWRLLLPTSGSPPSPRHSHAAVVYGRALYVFSGYDGSYRNDFHRFDFLTSSWSPVSNSMFDMPRPRYRATCVTSGNKMILHGGHDGTRHLQDTHIYDFDTNRWSLVVSEGVAPSPRDSHTAVMCMNSMFVYGGSTGAAMSDFYEFNIDTRIWSLIKPFQQLRDSDGITDASSVGSVTHYNRYRDRFNQSSTDVRNIGTPVSPQVVDANTVNSSQNQYHSSSEFVTPGCRFCHICVVYDNYLYVLGGYDGTHRLNDFLCYKLFQEPALFTYPKSTIVSDLSNFVNNDLFSDITFIVEDKHIRAHKILCIRCPYFHNMLTGEYMESRLSEIVIHDISYSTFLSLLEYIYTDNVSITMDNSMDLLHTADRFDIDRLKRMSEDVILSSVTIANVSDILLSADMHNATDLREYCLLYILRNFDQVSKSIGFEEMGKNKIELVFEILKRR